MTDLLKTILMIKKTNLFHGVSTEELRVVANEFEEELFFSGDIIFLRGDLGEKMYVIDEGSVGVSLQQQTRDNEFVAVLGAGECFGEMGLLDGSPRSATVKVLSSARILSLEKGRFRGLIINYPELAFGIMRSLSARLRSSNDKISMQ